ncbi:hypothetical protein EG68_04477 [Paragonimus skrjabini miyazakii]|uniref:Uncharacterized protein n=1 Tax=Paragonimus skrjabini miyazakii TaxID=59628 RepID=A0A8S9Z1Z9_9TREM|nr:hypothetical protein EG68_04477 [Paragonimus skrjabini miyazakii]
METCYATTQEDDSNFTTDLLPMMMFTDQVLYSSAVLQRESDSHGPLLEPLFRKNAVSRCLHIVPDLVRRRNRQPE